MRADGGAPMRVGTGYDYHRPRSLEEAWRIAESVPGARFVAGGTDVLVKMMKRRFPVPPALVSLRSVPGLRGIREEGGVRIGALTTLTEIVESPLLRERFPVLPMAARTMGRVQVRNVATVGGNLCNASPAADTAPPLLVLGARVVLESPGGRRELPLEEFLLGPGRTALRPGEILTALLLDPPGPEARAIYLRRGRTRMDLALASVAAGAGEAGKVLRGVRVAAGAVAPVPLRLLETEALLEGREATEDRIAAACAAASREVAPITDLPATESYRRHLVGVLLRRALARLAAPEAAP